MVVSAFWAKTSLPASHLPVSVYFSLPSFLMRYDVAGTTLLRGEDMMCVMARSWSPFTQDPERIGQSFGVAALC
jgi:hypothetical protein